eukprot:6174026-Lingulodinium_polyedra.AAC.1
MTGPRSPRLPGAAGATDPGKGAASTANLGSGPGPFSRKPSLPGRPSPPPTGGRTCAATRLFR